MIDPKKNLAWDEELGDQLVGKILLVGVTYNDPMGKLVEQKQMFGEVVVADPARGICIKLMGGRSGEHYWLPPDTRGIKIAEAGEYRLRETGEIVVNPDFTSYWTIVKGDANRTIN